MAKEKKKKKVNDGHYHEMQDRLHCNLVMIDELLLTHPVALKHAAIKKLIDKASGQLAKAYQLTAVIND